MPVKIRPWKWWLKIHLKNRIANEKMKTKIDKWSFIENKRLHETTARKIMKKCCWLVSFGWRVGWLGWFVGWLIGWLFQGCWQRNWHSGRRARPYPTHARARHDSCSARQTYSNMYAILPKLKSQLFVK